ncbi:S-formylglutathione hydrolase [Marinobacter sp. M1N3S26]|uniref:S-formylglutathione hydrolase n=1 Tax=unclassified Marinobacter TaxID=83889 RepID=UPI00387B869F
MQQLEQIAQNRVFDGVVTRYRHPSASTKTDMTFSIFLPPQAEHQEVPVLYWLSGLTCTDENFVQKAGAFRLASQLGLAIVCPDTSPRGTDLPGEHDSYDFGSGAGFYVNATQAPWSEHYRMYDYVLEELPAMINEHFPVNGKRSISGHSMGGHGALVCALRNPGAFESVSAFAPIANPSQCPWGQKALGAYLGPDRDDWREWDASSLIRQGTSKLPLLVDQGTADQFLEEQLLPSALQAACAEAEHPLDLRMREGYDHSYFFVSTFMDDHLRYHSRALGLDISE